MGRKPDKARARQGHKSGDLKLSYPAQMRVVEEAGVEDGWKHPEQDIEPISPDASLQLIMAMADKLSRIFSFIAAGRGGLTMDMRVWVVLYCIRPDLLKGESTRSYAMSRKVSDGRMRALVKEFKELLPKGSIAPSSRSSQPPAPPPGKASLWP